MNVGSGDAVPACFDEEKIDKFTGAKPPASLCVLSPRGERTWPRIQYPFLAGLRSLCADISQQKSGLPATFFLHTKKEGKDVPRGVPLEPRMVLIFRAIVGHHNGG